MPTLMLLYSAGWVGIFLMFTLMTLHAHRKREKLELDAREIHITRTSIRAHLSTGIGVLSIAMVLIDPWLTPWSGMIYGLMGPAHGLNGYFSGRALEKLPRSGGPS